MRTHRHEFARTVNAKLFVSNLQTRHAQTQNSYTDKTICAYLFVCVCVQIMKRAMYYTNEYFRFLYIIFWSKASLSLLCGAKFEPRDPLH